MASVNLIEGATSVNPTRDAFERRTAQLKQERKEEDAGQLAAQKRHDDMMLQIFEFAGDGRVNEARQLAKTNNIQVPEDIYRNADFAKGLSLAGSIYGDDPQAAQKFTTAWASSPQADFDTRISLAQKAAGKPIDPNDRDFNRRIRFEKWKMQNIPQKPPVSRFEAGQKAYNEVMGSGLGSPEQAMQARQTATDFWDQEYGGAGVSPGLMAGQVRDPSLPPPPPVNVGNTGQATMPDYSAFAPSGPQQLPPGLPQGSVLIGTANGRPVYQAPNGERFIDDGTP